MRGAGNWNDGVVSGRMKLVIRSWKEKRYWGAVVAGGAERADAAGAVAVAGAGW